MRNIRLLALLFAVPGLAACSHAHPLADRVQALGAEDLKCPAEQLEVYRGEGGLMVAKGCGRWTAYACIADRGRGFPDRGRVVCFHDGAAVVHPIAEQP